MSEALAGEVEGLAGDLAVVGLATGLFFEHAMPLAVRFDAPRAWADVLVTKALGPRQGDDAIAGRLARRLVTLEAAFGRANPQALEELELRSEPLREQWAARGPGLMTTLARLTADEAIVAEADVILVQPALGGGGGAHPKYNSVSIEAVLANPMSELPEVVRLGWLLAQLNLDLPKYEEVLPRDRLLEVGPLAMVPAVLAASQEVELARLDEPTLVAGAGRVEYAGRRAGETDRVVGNLPVDVGLVGRCHGSARPYALGRLVLNATPREAPSPGPRPRFARGWPAAIMHAPRFTKRTGRAMQLTLKIPRPPVIQIALDYATFDEALAMAKHRRRSRRRLARNRHAA